MLNKKDEIILAESLINYIAPTFFQIFNQPKSKGKEYLELPTLEEAYEKYKKNYPNYNLFFTDDPNEMKKIVSEEGSTLFFGILFKIPNETSYLNSQEKKVIYFVDNIKREKIVNVYNDNIVSMETAKEIADELRASTKFKGV